jgi:hypothetical protein
MVGMSNTPAEASFAQDLLEGAAKIAVFLYDDPKRRRDVYRNPGNLPFFTIGSTICARKSTLTAEIAAREKAARERLAAVTAAPKAQPRPKRPRRRTSAAKSAEPNTHQTETRPP